MSLNRGVYGGVPALMVVCLILSMAAPVAAQERVDPNPGKVAVTGGLDLRNAYMFRGVLQDGTGIIAWPHADLGLGLHSGDGGLKNVSLHVGTWNSLNSGVAGSDGRSGKPWYESDVYASLGLQFGGGIGVATTYTAYTSPNSMFTTVKEVGLRLAVDDGSGRRAAAVNPYALVAFELDTQPGIGQLDGGLHAGKYLELGIAPKYGAKRLNIGVPVKLGLSLGNYYELAGKDRKLGYASFAGIVTVPLGGITSSIGWNLHGGVEYQMLGDMPKAINDGDGSKLIGSVGVGFSY
jgi:hypothetical protein